MLSKIIHKVEVNFGESILNNCDSNKSSDSELVVFPSCIVNGTAVSKTFHIMYKNQEILLHDVIKFKAFLLVDVNNCIDIINQTVFAIDVELWFTDQEFVPNTHNLMECVASRQIILHFDVFRGLHYSLPIMFDYFHLCAITLAIHASLISVCQSCSAKGKIKSNSKEVPSDAFGQGYDMLLFGCSYTALNIEGGSDAQTFITIRLRRAQLIHWQLCSLLVIAIQSLKSKLNEYINLLSPLAQLESRTNDLNLAIEKLSQLAQKCYQSCLKTNQKPASFNFVAYQNGSFPSTQNNMDSSGSKSVTCQLEEYLTSVQSDIAYLCGFAIFQWQAFLKVVLYNEKVNQYLAKVHHLHRIKRFSEAFFTIEKSRKCIVSSCDNLNEFSKITDILRKSLYLSLLPRCDVECLALDGDVTMLPIIYEEHYEDHAKAYSNEITFKQNEPKFVSETSSRKNLKERFLNNLNRFNFGHIKLLEDHSSTSTRFLSSPIKRFNKKNLSFSIKNSPSAFELRNTVTLLGFKKYDEVNYSDKGENLSSRKRIKESESLPNLSSKCASFSRSRSKPIDDGLSLLKISEHHDLNSFEPNFAESTQFVTKSGFIVKKSASKQDELSSKSIESHNEDNEEKDNSNETDKCTILDMFKDDQCLICAKKDCNCAEITDFKVLPSLKRLSAVTSDVISFVTSKEEFRTQANLKDQGWNIFSDFSSLASRMPYFQCDPEFRAFNIEGLHLVICVHGLDGTCSDLRLVRTYLELGLPTTNFEFLMSQRNQGETFASFQVLTDRLVEEIVNHIEANSLKPKRIR